MNDSEIVQIVDNEIQRVTTLLNSVEDPSALFLTTLGLLLASIGLAVFYLKQVVFLLVSNSILISLFSIIYSYGSYQAINKFIKNERDIIYRQYLWEIRNENIKPLLTALFTIFAITLGIASLYTPALIKNIEYPSRNLTWIYLLLFFELILIVTSEKELTYKAYLKYTSTWYNIVNVVIIVISLMSLLQILTGIYFIISNISHVPQIEWVGINISLQIIFFFSIFQYLNVLYIRNYLVNSLNELFEVKISLILKDKPYRTKLEKALKFSNISFRRYLKVFPHYYIDVSVIYLKLLYPFPKSTLSK